MPLDTDTFLVTVYCVVDELYQSELAPAPPPRPGRAPASPIVKCSRWPCWPNGSLGGRSAGSCGTPPPIGAATSRADQPERLQSPRSQLLAAACPPGARAGTSALLRLARHPSLRSLGWRPGPACPGCRGRRHRLFGAEAGIGHGGADRARNYGVEVWATTDATGLITGFVVGPAGHLGVLARREPAALARRPHGTAADRRGPACRSRPRPPARWAAAGTGRDHRPAGGRRDAAPGAVRQRSGLHWAPVAPALPRPATEPSC